MLSMTTDIFTVVSKHVNMDCTFLNFAFRTKDAYYLCNINTDHGCAADTLDF